MKLTHFFAAAAFALSSFFPAAAQQTRVRVGQDVSHQHFRFSHEFPDHGWGFYRDRYMYGGLGESVYFNNGRVALGIGDHHQRRVSSPWRKREETQTTHKTKYNAAYVVNDVTNAALPEAEARRILQHFFADAKLQYSQDTHITLGNGRTRRVDFLVEGIPVEYVAEKIAFPIFQHDKKVYDGINQNNYILIPPSSRTSLLDHLKAGLYENGY